MSPWAVSASWRSRCTLLPVSEKHNRKQPVEFVSCPSLAEASYWHPRPWLAPVGGNLLGGRKGRMEEVGQYGPRP